MNGGDVAILGHSSPGSVREALAALAEAVDRLAALADPAAHPRVEGAEAASVVTGALALAGRLTAVAARALPAVEADGWWSLDGARSITSWVAANGRVSHGQAARLVGLGRALRDDLPVTALDAVSGAVSIESAHVLASVASTPARKAALAAAARDCGEQFLVEHARTLAVGQLRILARRWAAHADPDADERGYREASEREFVDLANTTDGWHLAGFLTTEHGHALAMALDAMAVRSADQAGQPAGRRRATALNNLVRTVLDRDLTGATGDHRPQVTVVTDLATLHRALNRDASERAWSLPAVPRRPLTDVEPDSDQHSGEPGRGQPRHRPTECEAPQLAGGPAAEPQAARCRDEPLLGAAAGDPPGGGASVLPGGGASVLPGGGGPSERPGGGDASELAGRPSPGSHCGRTPGREDRAPRIGDDGRRAGLPVTPVGLSSPSGVGELPAGPGPIADVERFAVAELVGTGPIPDSVLARLACDSQITRVVFGARSVVLNVGRAERTYTGAKRRAIIARDGLCRFPGCSAPPAMSEVHHTDHWLRDQGETDVHTGVLVCWHHHELIHARGIEVRRGADGRWRFVDQRGRELVVAIG